jgi:hypothetical protein
VSHFGLRLSKIGHYPVDNVSGKRLSENKRGVNENTEYESCISGLE